MSARNEDFLFAQEAEKLGYISEQQVEEAFLLQRKMSEDLKIDERLAVILVKRGWLAEEQARRVYGIVDPKGASQQIEGYRLVAKIGRGAMGTVYKAIHLRLNRAVAIKILRRDLATDKTQIERLKAEAQLLASLDHPNIVRAIDAGESNGFPYFVMEYVEGENLRDAIIRKGPFDEDDALRITRDLANALERARRMGVVHRDVKPGNVLLTRRGQIPKLMDLGLAKGPIDLGLTQQGSTVGTPQFISPEQAQDPRKADTRSDIYSLGATLYAMLTSRPPFEGATLAEIITKVLYEQPTPIRVRNDDVSPEVSYLVQRMMLKDPSLRYRTPADVAEDIDRIRGGQSIVPQGFEGNWEAFLLRRRMKRWVRRGAIAAVAIVALGIGTLLLVNKVKRDSALERISGSETRLLTDQPTKVFHTPLPDLGNHFPANIDAQRVALSARAAAVRKAQAQAEERRAYIVDQEEIAGTRGHRHDEVTEYIADLAELAADIEGMRDALRGALTFVARDPTEKTHYAKAIATLKTYFAGRTRTAPSPVDVAFSAAREEIMFRSNNDMSETRMGAATHTLRPSSLPRFASDWRAVLNDFHSGRFVPTTAHNDAVRDLQGLMAALDQTQSDLESLGRAFGPEQLTPDRLAQSVTSLVTRFEAKRTATGRDARTRLQAVSVEDLSDLEQRLLGPGRPITDELVNMRNRIDRAVEAHNDELILRATSIVREEIDPLAVAEFRSQLSSWAQEIESPYPGLSDRAQAAREKLNEFLNKYRNEVLEFFVETRNAVFAALQAGDPEEARKVFTDALRRRDPTWAADARLDQLGLAADYLEQLQSRALRVLEKRLQSGRVLEHVRLRDVGRMPRFHDRWTLLAVNPDAGTVEVDARAPRMRIKAATFSIHEVHPEQLMTWVSKALSDRLVAVARLSAMHHVRDEPGVDLRKPFLIEWQRTREAFDALDDGTLSVWTEFVRDRYDELRKAQAARERGAELAEITTDTLRQAGRWVEAQSALRQFHPNGRLHYTDAHDQRELQLEDHGRAIDAALKRDELRELLPGAKVDALSDNRHRVGFDCDTPEIQKRIIVSGLGEYEREPVNENITPLPSIAPHQLHLHKGSRSLIRDRPLAFPQIYDPALPIEWEMTIQTLAGSYLLAFDIDGAKVAVVSADPRIHDRRPGAVPLIKDENKLPEYNFYGMGRGIAFQTTGTGSFGNSFPMEGWNWDLSMRGRNFKAWADVRRVAKPKNRLRAFEEGREYKVKIVRDFDNLKLFVDGELWADQTHKSWRRLGTRSDKRKGEMRHGSGLLQLLTWTPLIVDDIVFTGTLNRRWIADRKAELKAEKAAAAKAPKKEEEPK